MAKKKNKKKASFQSHFFTACGVILAVVLLPSTMLLVAGMAPTIAAFFVDNTKKKTKVLTVGSMNLAGCTPFLFELWMYGKNFEKSLSIIFDPQAIVIMYTAAAIGYTIDWGLTAFISTIMYQQGLKRQKEIKQRQSELIERWGKHVSGEVPLDDYGFPVKKEESKKAKN